jgi:predicted PurR-regulated permease PerM
LIIETLFDTIKTKRFKLEVEKLKVEVFEKFGIKVDESDPLWAILFVNEKISQNFVEIIENSTKTQNEKRDELNSLFEKFSKLNSDIESSLKKIDIESIEKSVENVNSSVKTLKSSFRLNTLFVSLVTIITSAIVGFTFSYYESREYFEQNFRAEVEKEAKKIKDIESVVESIKK